MSLYLISFDITRTDPLLAHEAITSVPQCDWWHYMSGLYLLGCPDSLTAVRQALQSKWPGGYLFITAIQKTADGHHPDGLLPQDAWAWINNHL